MNASKVIGILMVLMMVLCIVWVLRGTSNPPVMPGNSSHVQFESADTCLLCHGPNGMHPRPKTHPISRECMRCHAFAKSR